MRNQRARGVWGHAVPVCLMAALALASTAQAGTMGLSWDPVDGASGYRIYYGTSSGDYSDMMTTGNVTSTSLVGLDDCTAYYVAVKAFNAAGESPTFSNEISGWARPDVVSLDPALGTQGDRLIVDLTGANFHANASLMWDLGQLPEDIDGNPLVRLESISVMSCNRIQAQLQIEPLSAGFRAAPLGPLTLAVEVENPDGVFGTASTEMVVEFDSRRADINRSQTETTDRVDGQDLVWLAYAYGTVEGAERFNPDADLNGDGMVDGDDLALLSPTFGRCWDGSGWDGTACP